MYPLYALKGNPFASHLRKVLVEYRLSDGDEINPSFPV